MADTKFAEWQCPKEDHRAGREGISGMIESVVLQDSPPPEGWRRGYAPLERVREIKLRSKESNDPTP